MKNNLIFVQWDAYYGGLEKISQLYEKIFTSYNPLVAILRQTKSGFKYNNSYVFKEKNKLSFIFNYFRFVKNKKDSIFHIQYAGSTILLVTFLAGARKILFHFHGTKFSNKILNKLIWKLLEKKVVIIANSLHTKEVIKKKLNLQNQITVIPNLIDTKALKYIDRVYKKGDKFTVLYTGRFDKGKNIDLIVEVAKTLNYDNEIGFLLVGDGPEKETINRKINENNLGSAVKILMYTDEIMKFYYSSNLFIFTSLHESFGNVIAEAILTGLPVLSNKLPALTEFVNDDFFFFDKQDPKLIAVKIKEIKYNYPMATMRLNKVNTNLRAYLDNEKIVSTLSSLYNNLNN
ncbi:MAG: glycosyltransferase [Sphingobacteriaceae bacterium]|nr:glycosyltransferase [Sphingobacteriaceae bacterium]